MKQSDRKGELFIRVVRVSFIILQAALLVYCFYAGFLFGVRSIVTSAFYLLASYTALYGLDLTGKTIVRGVLLFFCAALAFLAHFPGESVFLKVLIAAIFLLANRAVFLCIDGIASKYGVYWFRAMG